MDFSDGESDWWIMPEFLLEYLSENHYFLMIHTMPGMMHQKCPSFLV